MASLRLKTLLIGLLSTTGIGASELPEKLVLCEDPWPPYVNTKGDTVTGGIAVDIVKEIGTRSGIEFGFKTFPWKRCIQLVGLGEMDGMIIALKNPSRPVQYTKTAILEDPISFFYLRSNFPEGFTWSMPKDFQDKAFAALLGTTLLEPVPEAIEKYSAKLSSARNVTQMFRMLARGRVDFSISNTAVGWETIRKLRLDPKLFGTVQPPISESEYFTPIGNLTVAKYPKLLDTLNKTIESMIEDGTIAYILKSYE